MQNCGEEDAHAECRERGAAGNGTLGKLCDARFSKHPGLGCFCHELYDCAGS